MWRRCGGCRGLGILTDTIPDALQACNMIAITTQELFRNPRPPATQEYGSAIRVAMGEAMEADAPASKNVQTVVNL